MTGWVKQAHASSLGKLGMRKLMLRPSSLGKLGMRKLGMRKFMLRQAQHEDYYFSASR
jgi:hypothetical protein